ncbi:CotH kinase family protein [Aldersonia sp. NBC_00410]|uniref:CotH kinase family protein n=1 Tax=Aldersonia sp. NBC_00410 TaxID=2975954 RepID=UPI002256B2B0|nr:CotH kinase family protein [Aldersonia sp. NBC_00410]MCX5044961.1 CotH kinase family protein [Aldersonia sp. NBC_00410]
MTTEQQLALDSLYALDNVLTVRITMAPQDWDAVRNEQPKGGPCNFDWRGGSRYEWREAESVEISGTDFPARTSFRHVGIKKKSFCGSINSAKPCLHIDFGKFRKSNVPTAEALIGTQYLTLNNSIQDPSYVRQTIGYRLYERAGLPNSRCNYARVFVNGTPIGAGLIGVNSPGIYVSAEPIMPRYIERNFAGNMNGNLYELEHTDDFVDKRFDLIGVEDLSKFGDKADLRFAIDHIAANGLAGAADVFDLDQFIGIYAMDFLLKHWDGYSRNTNNTYIYNDVDAVAAPGVDTINFKTIPWGIDQTLQPQRHFYLGTDGLVAEMIRNDPTRRKQVLDRIATYRDTVLDRDSQDAVLRPMFEKAESLLNGFGVPNASAEIAAVRKQLRLAASAGFLIAGLPDGKGAYIRDDATNDVLHAGKSDTIPRDAPNPTNFEVTHRPRPPAPDDSDLWSFGDLDTGKSLTSKAFGRLLHAGSISSSQGHQLLYTCPPNNAEHAEEFRVAPIDARDEFSHSGYFSLVSVRTGLGALFGTDPTPSGHPRVHQEGGGSKLFFS